MCQVCQNRYASACGHFRQRDTEKLCHPNAGTQLNPAVTDVKGPMNFICYRLIHVITTIMKNDKKGPNFHSGMPV